MKIKVGEYVRTKDGLIAKLISIDEDEYCFDNKIKWYYEYYSEEVYAEDWKDFVKDEVAKHSPNIIDLIEVGDYVNGKKILEIKKGMESGLRFLLYDNVPIRYYVERTDDIKSIVTKEQFAGMEYKV